MSNVIPNPALVEVPDTIGSVAYDAVFSLARLHQRAGLVLAVAAVVLVAHKNGWISIPALDSPVGK